MRRRRQEGSIAWPWRAPFLSRRNRVAKRQRRRDGRNRLSALAYSQDGDVAVVEQTTQNGLIDVDTLDLVERHFEGAALDEAGLVHHPPVGDIGLGGEPVEPASGGEIQRYHRYDGGRGETQHG